MDLKYLKHLAKRGAPYIHPKGHEATRLLIEKLEIKYENEILEVGCGTGATLCEIASQFDIKIEGIDILEDMVKIANERINYLELQSKAEVKLYLAGKSFPYENETFDKIYAESVLGFQDIYQIEFLFREIYRILKPSGLFVINELLWSESADPVIITEINKKATETFGLGPASVYKITKESFIQIARDSEFQLIKVIELNNFTIEEAENKNPSLSKLQKKFNRKLFLKKLISFEYLIDEINFRKNISKQNKYVNLLYPYLFIFIKPSH